MRMMETREMLCEMLEVGQSYVLMQVRFCRYRAFPTGLRIGGQGRGRVRIQVHCV